MSEKAVWIVGAEYQIKSWEEITSLPRPKEFIRKFEELAKTHAPWAGKRDICNRVDSLYKEWAGFIGISGPNWHISWVTLVDDIKSPSKCNCPIMLGCQCGAFVAEMKALGAFYDKSMRVWRRR